MAAHLVLAELLQPIWLQPFLPPLYAAPLQAQLRALSPQGHSQLQGSRCFQASGSGQRNHAQPQGTLFPGRLRGSRSRMVPTPATEWRPGWGTPSDWPLWSPLQSPPDAEMPPQGCRAKGLLAPKALAPPRLSHRQPGSSRPSGGETLGVPLPVQEQGGCRGAWAQQGIRVTVSGFSKPACPGHCWRHLANRIGCVGTLGPEK